MSWTRPPRLLAFTAVVFLGQVSLSAQTADPASPNFVERFLHNEGALWTSPLRVNRQDMKWLLPLGAGTALLKTVDSRISREAAESNLQNPSRIVSDAGNIPVLVAPVALLALGKVSHNEKTRKTGELSLEAVLHSSVIVQVVKHATNRERPNKDNSRGDFWDGGQSFPSGHAITAFSFATVLAKQYPENKWIKFGSYGFAGAVGLSRIGGLNHFPSDVLVGASMGYLIGRYVVRH